MKATKKMLTAVATGVLANINHDNFKEAAQAVFVAAASVRDNIQSLTEFAIQHANEHDNNFELVTYLLQLATSKYGNGVRSETLKNYIEAVVVGGQFTRTKEGDVFRKASKKTKIKYDMELLSGTKWYEFDQQGIAQPKLDFLQALIAQVQKWEKESTNEETKYDVQNREQNDRLVSDLKQRVNDIAGEEVFAV